MYADFSPKPIAEMPGNGFHINFSVKGGDEQKNLPCVIAGILDKIYDMTAFLNPIRNSYERLGKLKAPKYITWSSQNRSQLIRIPAGEGAYRRAELRSPDPMANPYLAYTLLIYAGLYGIENQLELPRPADINLYLADKKLTSEYKKLPENLDEAAQAAAKSKFITGCLPKTVIETYCG